MAQLNFNSQEVEPQAGFELLPAGWQHLLCEKCELKPTNAGDGSYLNFQWKVVGGEFNNRVVFDMIMYTHPKEQTQQIGRAKLSALCRAMGIGNLTSTDMFNNRHVEGKVAVQKSKDPQYEDKNIVREFRQLEQQGANFADDEQNAAGTAGTAGAGEPSGTVADQQDDDEIPEWEK